MRKKQMTIVEYNYAFSVHTIVINNIRYQNGYENIIKCLFEKFLFAGEVFFGFCRTDGTNLSLKQERQLNHEIPLFFKTNGSFQKMDEYLTVARLGSSKLVYDFIPKIFDYYLDTVMFNPKVEWDTFKQYHSNYQNHRFEDYILNGFSEFIFCYFDSGDLVICFDSQKYSAIEIKNVLKLLVNNNIDKI